MITPKGLRELFILSVVPAVKFDWLACKGKGAIVPSLGCESPSFGLQKSGLFKGDVLAEEDSAAARVGRAALVSCLVRRRSVLVSRGGSGGLVGLSRPSHPSRFYELTVEVCSPGFLRRTVLRFDQRWPLC